MSARDAVPGRMGIESRVVVAMVGSMHSRPPNGRAFESQITGEHPEILDRFTAGERSVSQQAMVSKGDSHGMHDIRHYKNDEKFDHKSLHSPLPTTVLIERGRDPVITKSAPIIMTRIPAKRFLLVMLP